MGRCPGVKPLESLIPMGGGGQLTVVIENPPDFRFTENTGTSTATISLALGKYSYGEFVRVAFGDGESAGNGEVEKSEVVALEFQVSSVYYSSRALSLLA